MAPSGRQDSPVVTQPGSLEQLRKFAGGHYLYAITDGAYCSDLIGGPAANGTERVVSLLKPHPAIEPSAIPHLIHVTEPVLDWIFGTVHGMPWGTFVMSKAEPDELRVHFRRFLMVELPDGERWYFRFYDPRLLPVYLSTCNEWELRKFFGPVRAFGIPAMEQASVTILRYDSPKGDVSTDPYASLVWHIRPEQAEALLHP
jgi:hypothetical protein